MTRRQSNNQWSGGIAARPVPKKFRMQKSAGNVLASSLIIFQRSNYKRGVLFISAGAIEGHFEGKTPREIYQGILFLHDKGPAHRALANQKKLAYLGFQCLDHPPYSPDLATSDYHVFPGLKKTIEYSPFFVRCGGHCCCGDLVGRTTF